MAVQVSVRLTEEDVASLDALVQRGRFGNRSEALRAALAELLREEREREIEDAYRRGYGKYPQEEWIGEWSLALFGAWSRAEGGDSISIAAQSTTFSSPKGARPAVIITRDSAISLPANVSIAGVTRTVRGLPTEVRLNREHGVDDGCVVNCDNQFTLPKRALGRRRGSLDERALAS